MSDPGWELVVQDIGFAHHTVEAARFDPAFSHSGVGSLRVEVTENTYAGATRVPNYVRFDEVTILVPGHNYEISGFSVSDNGNWLGLVGAELFDTAGVHQGNWLVSPPAQTPGEWVPLSGVFTADATMTVLKYALYWQGGANQSLGQVWFDDLRMVDTDVTVTPLPPGPDGSLPPDVLDQPGDISRVFPVRFPFPEGGPG